MGAGDGEGVPPPPPNITAAGGPLSLTRKLQLVQNAAARVLTGTPWGTHMQPVLRQLHWLPVAARIRFMVWVMTFKAVRGLDPAYLKERLPLYAPRRALRSSNANLLVVPGPREARLASTRARAFSVLAPTWWNELPEDLRALTELSQFCRACKMELFRWVYG